MRFSLTEEGYMTHLYFAYGSNLNPEQMQRRCPDSQFIDIATLRGFHLAFAGHSRRWGGGVATVLEAPKDQVEGIVWSISDRDLESLDRCEGYPYSYDRLSFEVQLASGEPHSALIYVKQNPNSAPPSAEYLAVIQRAYEDRGFDVSELARAAKR